MVSILSDPAIEVKGQYFAGLITPPCHQTWDGTDNCQCIIIDGEWTTGDNPCDFCLENKNKWDALNFNFKAQQFKQVDDKQIIVGPALIPNKKIFRRDEETGDEYFVVFTPEVIKMIVEKFNRTNNNKSINLDHTNTMAPAYIMGNWLVGDSVYDKSKMYGYDLPVDTWFIEVKVDDTKFWNEQVKELGKYSFSVEGLLGQKLMKFAIKPEDNTDYLVSQLTDKELTDLANFTLNLLVKNTQTKK